MSMKKYDLFKILRELNELNHSSLCISPDIKEATILYDKQKDIFGPVSYIYYYSPFVRKIGIETFVEDYIISTFPTMIVRRIKTLIRKKQTDTTKLEIKIFPPTRIRYAYLYTNYFSCKGSLGSSCMRYKENQKSLNFYVKNNVRIVV